MFLQRLFPCLQEKKKWFAFAFLGSILWIAIYSYLMVWWATLVGDTFGMPAEVMGLTFLAGKKDKGRESVSKFWANFLFPSIFF